MVDQNFIKSREGFPKSGRGEVAPTKMEMSPHPIFLNDHVYILDCGSYDVSRAHGFSRHVSIL